MSSDLAPYSDVFPVVGSPAAGEFAAAADWPVRDWDSAELRRLRVLLIAESCGGGVGRHVVDLAEGLLDRGCEVHLIDAPGRADRTFRERLERLPQLRRATLPLRRAPHPSDLKAIRRIRRYLHDYGPFDIVHGHGSKGGAMARLSTPGTGAAAFYTPHGLAAMDPGLGRPKRLFYHAIEWTLSHLSRRIIAVSPEERRFCIRKGLGRKRLIMIPNGIEAIPFPSRDEARRDLDLPDNALVAGFVGRLVDQKAPDVLIEAFARAARAHRRALLVMVGAGPLERPLRALAEEMGVAGRVRWLGEREAWRVLPAFDLFVLSSRKEGLPYVVLEAMAAGLPIVATDASGVEVLVRPRRNGLVVPAGRPDALGEALRALFSDPGRLAAYSRVSLERAAQFTVDCMVERTLSEYARFARPEPSALAGVEMDPTDDGFSHPLTNRATGAGLDRAQ